ncbi:MAG: glycerol-3-phosphate 1-O-acyltransferase PlsY [Bacteroidota bacterium]|nr:glycerol-3-phosphate 1-O-acyltransferase PlsY [Bacteroidota bacterium]
MILEFIIAFIIAYLIGAIPFAIIIGKTFYGIDVRKHGSGNAGATNTIRVLGLNAGLPVLILDALKGFLAVKIAYIFYLRGILTGESYINLEIILGFAAIIGHVLPIYIGFKGGKGISTLLGIGLTIFTFPALIGLGIFMVIFILTRYVSLGSIITAISFPAISIFLFNMGYPSQVIFSVSVAILVPITHTKNIIRLFKGEESKIDIFAKKKIPIDKR